MNFANELKKEAFDFAFAVHRVTELFPKEEALKKELREYSAGLLAKVSSLEPAENPEKLTLTRSILGVLEALKNLIFLSQKTGLMKAINAEVLERERTALEIYFQHECDVLVRGQGREQKRDEIRPTPTPNGVGAPTASVGEAQVQNDTEQINDTKISVNDILKAQRQALKTPLVAPGASNSISDADGSPDNGTDNGINERQGAIIGYLKANKEARMTDLVTIFSNRFSIKTLQRDLARLITNGDVVRQGDKRWAVYRLNSL